MGGLTKYERRVARRNALHARKALLPNPHADSAGVRLTAEDQRRIAESIDELQSDGAGGWRFQTTAQAVRGARPKPRPIPHLQLVVVGTLFCGIAKRRRTAKREPTPVITTPGGSGAETQTGGKAAQPCRTDRRDGET